MTGKALVNRIDKYLRDKNLKRQALCEFVGIAPNTLTAWKRRGTLPQADILVKIALFFELSVDEFIEDIEEGSDSFCVHEQGVPSYLPMTSRARRENEIIKDLHFLADNDIEIVFTMVHGLAEKRRHERTMKETVG